MRILITGNGGAGKSWLAAKLADRLQLPLVRLDDIYWAGAYGGEGRDKQQVFDDVRTAAAADAWVIEGVYGWLLPAALPRATEFIFLDLPVEGCLANLQARGIQGGGDAAGFESMLTWVAEYPTRQNANSRAAHQRLWDAHEGGKHLLTSRDEIEGYLAGVAG